MTPTGILCPSPWLTKHDLRMRQHNVTAVCPTCGGVLTQNDTRDGGVIVRTNVVKISSDGLTVRAKCKSCGELVRLPLVEQKRQIVVQRKRGGLRPAPKTLDATPAEAQS